MQFVFEVSAIIWQPKLAHNQSVWSLQSFAFITTIF